MRLILSCVLLAACGSSAPKPELELETPDVCNGVRFRDDAGEVTEDHPSMSDDVTVTSDDDYVYAWFVSETDVRRYELGDAFMGKVETRVVPLDDRYTAVTARVEHYGRTEDGDGPGATYVAGYVEHDAVIDVRTGHLVWVHTERVDGDDSHPPIACREWGKVSLADDTFTVGRCDGSESFALEDVESCRDD